MMKWFDEMTKARMMDMKHQRVAIAVRGEKYR